MKKKIIISIVVVLVLVAGFFFFKNNKVVSPTVDNQEQKNTVSLCYYYLNKTDRGLYDKAWLRLDLNGEKVTGEFDNYPAEKDSKVGTFSGTVGSLNQNTMGRTAELWWNSLAEGMEVKEELQVEFGDGSASALYGEMVDRGDGVYVYKDKTEMSFGPSLGQISCEDLDEINVVEKYVKDNIKTIATNKPVLGGSWYVTSIFVNYTLNEGTVTYEDGHIESKAIFQYDFDVDAKKVTILKFEVQQ
jgi:hypothetical protein